MDMSWLESLLYGLISGLTEFLPVSSRAHQVLLRKLFGGEAAGLTDLMAHLGMLTALLTCCRGQIAKLRREQRLARIPKRRRKRQPDQRVRLDGRIVRTALLPLLLGFVFYLKCAELGEKLYLLSIFCILNGVILFLPALLPHGNKDSRSMSALDGWLLGLGAAMAVVPGISRIGVTHSVATMRGADRQNGLNWALLLSIPALMVLAAFDCYSMFAANALALSFPVLLKSILVWAASFGGAYTGIFILRFLSVNAGYSGFAYYSWGMALFTFILYLTT